MNIWKDQRLVYSQLLNKGITYKVCCKVILGIRYPQSRMFSSGNKTTDQHFGSIKKIASIFFLFYPFSAFFGTKKQRKFFGSAQHLNDGNELQLKFMNYIDRNSPVRLRAICQVYDDAVAIKLLHEIPKELISML